MHYSGWTKDGKMFDSSIPRGAPTTFGVGEVIPGWTEALKLMTVGEKVRIWIPGKLAYGDHPQMGGAPSGDLTFDVELLDIVKPPAVPEDVKAAPKSAKKTATGLAYRVVTLAVGAIGGGYYLTARRQISAALEESPNQPSSPPPNSPEDRLRLSGTLDAPSHK